MDPISVISCMGSTGTIQEIGPSGSLWSSREFATNIALCPTSFYCTQSTNELLFLVFIIIWVQLL